MSPGQGRLVDYFTVLARVRQLLPQGHDLLGHAALVEPETIAEAARRCGLTTEWSRFDPGGVSEFEDWMGDIDGAVYVVGLSSARSEVLAFEVACDRLDAIDRHIELFQADLALIGVTVPFIGLTHHEGLCTTVRCPLPLNEAEDPAQLAAHLRRLVDDRRHQIEKRLPPALLQRLAEASNQGARKIAAIKLLRDETGCSLADARDTVSSLWPWWPTGR